MAALAVAACDGDERFEKQGFESGAAGEAGASGGGQDASKGGQEQTGGVPDMAGMPSFSGAGGAGDKGAAAGGDGTGEAGMGSGEAGAAGSGAIDPNDYAELFDPAVMLELHIVLSPAAMEALSFDPSTYQAGSIEYGGRTYDNVGIRLKGRASFQGFEGKPSFKIKLDEFQQGQRFHGLKRLTLNNMTQDATMAHEVLGFELLRAMGLPAPRCNHARVFVNDEYYGLYANLQTLDEVFVREAFPGTTVGNLYDITNDEYFIDFERELFPPAQETRFVLETNRKAADISDLTALIDTVSLTSDTDFVTETEKLLNLDQVLTLGAAQAVIADWDGYFGARNNYKAYHDTGSGKFVILPWGIDQTFGYENVDYALDHTTSQRPRSLVYDRCERDASCLERYYDKLRLAVDTFETADLEASLDGLLTRSAAAIAADTRMPYTLEEHEAAVLDLRAFLQERAGKVRAQLP